MNQPRSLPYTVEKRETNESSVFASKKKRETHVYRTNFLQGRIAVKMFRSEWMEIPRSVSPLDLSILSLASSVSVTLLHFRSPALLHPLPMSIFSFLFWRSRDRKWKCECVFRRRCGICTADNLFVFRFSISFSLSFYGRLWWKLLITIYYLQTVEIYAEKSRPLCSAMWKKPSQVFLAIV